MTKISTISKVFFLFSAVLCSTLFGQTKKVKEKQNGTIVFGKVYTVEELRKLDGLIRCSSSEYEDYLQKKYPKRMNEGQFESWIHPLIQNAAGKSQSGDVITIPVVVHIIHSGQAYGSAPNITDAQVASQITVMNQDFRKMAGTRGANTEAVGADTKIQFALAKVDPNGNPTSGIHRVNMCQTSWSMEDIDNVVKPQTIWDPTQYMNMWSVNFSTAGLLGYAQFPSGSNLTGLAANGGLAETDGVVAGYYCFGSSDVNDGTFILGTGVDLGRTMTHEVGHFLGLRHLWGDGNCFTDYVDDTPFSSNVANAHYNCTVTQDSCPTMPGLDMVRNYMNYTMDACMNIFTNDQKARITAVMNNSPRRASLKTSQKDLAIPLFANDAELIAERNCANVCITTPVAVTAQFMLYNRGTANMTSAVITYSVNGGAQQTMPWSGNLVPGRYAMVNIPSGATQGTISASIASVNGVADQRPSNNNANVVIGNTVPVNSTNFTFNLQLDQYGSETSWDLKNSAGVTLYSGGNYPDADPAMGPLITQNWVLPVDQCYTFTIYDSWNDGIYDNGGYYNIKNSAGNVVVYGSNFANVQTRSFKVLTALSTKETEPSKPKFGIYPNPATDVLNITKASLSAQYEIYNAVGQLVKSGNIENNQVKVAELVKGTYIITVKDKDITENLKFIKK